MPEGGKRAKLHRLPWSQAPHRLPRRQMLHRTAQRQALHRQESRQAPHRRAGRQVLLMPAALIMLLLCLSGCRSILPAVSHEEDYSYTRAQAMIVAATERNRYQKAYTDQIWKAVMSDGQTFEEYMLSQVREFLKDLKTMNMLAADQGIVLTSAEKDRIRRLSELYYSGLTDEDIAYMGISRDDVQVMYQEYYLANKLVGELTKDVNLEVSDSEAKVIDVRMIKISDREAAEAVYGRITREESDFLSVARETGGGEETELKLWRGRLPEAAEKAAFVLAPEEISPVTDGGDGWFYIFQCVSDYDVEATRLRKDQIYKERKNQVFRQIYSQFQIDNKIEISDEIWETIRFSPEDKTSSDNFFSLYQEEFGGQA